MVFSFWSAFPLIASVQNFRFCTILGLALVLVDKICGSVRFFCTEPISENFQKNVLPADGRAGFLAFVDISKKSHRTEKNGH